MNLLMKGAALAPPFSCTTKYSSDVYSPRPPDIRVRLLPTKPPVHFTTEQPGRDNDDTNSNISKTSSRLTFTRTVNKPDTSKAVNANIVKSKEKQTSSKTE